MQLLHHRQRLTRGVGDHVRIREPVFLELAVEDLDLELERRRVGSAPEDCLLLAHACRPETRVTKPGEMVSAEHVAELILITKLLIPIGVEEKMRRTLPRPPRLLEVVIEITIDPDERRPDTGAHGSELIRGKRTGGIWQGRRRAPRPPLDSARRQKFWRQLRSRGVLRHRRAGRSARAHHERAQASPYVMQYFSSIRNGATPLVRRRCRLRQTGRRPRRPRRCSRWRPLASQPPRPRRNWQSRPPRLASPRPPASSRDTRLPCHQRPLHRKPRARSSVLVRLRRPPQSMPSPLRPGSTEGARRQGA